MRPRFGMSASALVVASLVFAFPSAASAASALGTSTWSLEVGTNVGSGDTDGSFAIRRHSGEGSAIRFGVEVDYNSFDGDGVIRDTGSPDADAAQWSEGSSHALSIQWMRFAPIRDNVTATFALGPVVEMQRNSARQGTNQGLPSFSESEFQFTNRSYGLDLGLGVEWFFTRRFTLGGQSGLRAMLGTGKQLIITRTGTGGTYSRTEIENEGDLRRVTVGAARIQLTGYF